MSESVEQVPAKTHLEKAELIVKTEMPATYTIDMGLDDIGKKTVAIIVDCLEKVDEADGAYITVVRLLAEIRAKQKAYYRTSANNPKAKAEALVVARQAEAEADKFIQSLPPEWLA